MKKYIISILIGLLSASGIVTGLISEQKEKNTNPVGIEGTAAADDSITKDLVTDNELKDETNNDALAKEDEIIEERTEEVNADKNIEETKKKVEREKESKPKERKETKEVQQRQEDKLPNKSIEKQVNLDSNKETESFREELENCDRDTVYSKVIINGKEYENFDADSLTNNLIKEETKVDKPAPPNNDSKAPESSNPSYGEEVLHLVNKERGAAGLSPLTMDSKLTAAANRRSIEIVGKFSHQRPNGSDFHTVLEEYGVNYRTSGENIAYGQPSPQAVVSAWMNSPGHRANILGSQFKKLGVGVHIEKGTIYWTQLFTN